jgi:DNA-binding transcriptional LysR family regulator
MRLEQLQAFLLVAELGSFQQAAHHCGVTQSTISRQIQALETELACQLFHRSASAPLTLAGKLFLRRARRIWQEWETATEELGELLAGKQTELCVAAIHSVCTSSLPLLLPQFCQQYPQIQLRVTALGSERALKVLRDGLVDIVIIMNYRNLVQTKELLVKILYEEPIFLVLGAHHPLAKIQNLTWENLEPYAQIAFKEGYCMRRLIEEEFSQRGMHPAISLEFNVPESFFSVLKISQMFAFLPQSLLIAVAQDPQLTICHWPPNLHRQIAVVTTVDRLEIPPIANLFNLIVAQLSTPADGST